MFRWTEIQCSPVFSGNFTPSGHAVKVTSGHKFAKTDGFTFAVRHLNADRVFRQRYAELLKSLVPSPLPEPSHPRNLPNVWA